MVEFEKIITIFGLACTLIGEISIGYAALKVHSRFQKEHKVDEKVFQEMHKEKYVGLVGISFLLAGFSLQVLAVLLI